MSATLSIVTYDKPDAIVLPPTVKRGQEFTAIVRRMSSRRGDKTAAGTGKSKDKTLKSPLIERPSWR